MYVNTYLENLINDKSEYSLTSEDQKIIKHEGLKRFIFNKLNSSKFRATAIGEDYGQKVLDKIELCINHEIPIYLTLPFGAIKNPYLPSYPYVDWAEVLNIVYLREYLKPIARAYKYGVVLEYISVAVFEEKVNRISEKDTNLYDREFTSLIKYFQKLLPKNFTLKYSRIEDEFPREKLERLLELKKTALRKV